MTPPAFTNRSGRQGIPRWVNTALEDILVRAYCAVEAKAKAESITFRESAFAIAVDRVVRAVELQGLP